MSGQKCNYFNCGKSKRNNPELSFHTFPSDEHSMKTWIVHSGKLLIYYIYILHNKKLAFTLTFVS